MSDATNDRGAKPPRTLFSLGRPAAKKDTPAAPPVDERATDALESDADTANTESATGADVETPAVAFEESGFLCGACDAPLPVGAVFCAECGTPVAALDDDAVGAADADAVEPAGAGAEVVDVADHAPPVEASGAEVSAASEPPAAPFEPVEEPAAAAFEPVEEPPAAPFEPAEPAEHGAFVPVEEPAAAAAFAPVEEPGAMEAVAGAPAAILYADPSQAEPLPPEPEGSWGIAEPATGTSDGTYLYGDSADATGPDPATNAWAEPAAAGTAAAVGAEVVGADLAGASPGEATGIEPAPVTAMAAAGVAPPPAGSGGTGAAAMPYGHGPVESTEKKSKTGLIVGAAAAAILVLVIGGVVLTSGGNKDAGNVQTAPQATTSTTAKATTTTSPAETSTTDKVTTTAVATTAASTVTTEAPTSSTPPTTIAVVTTAVPTTPRPTIAPTQPAPPTTLFQPGKINASPANGATVTIPKGGSTQIVLQNTGGAAASCTVSSGSGNLSVTPNCAPSISAGGSVTITIKANAGFEGQGSVQGLMEGIGSYNITVFVKNG